MWEICFSKNISIIVLENKNNTIRDPQIFGISWETTANWEQGRWPESKECSERNIYVKAYSDRHWSHKRACGCRSGWIALMAPVLHCPCILAICHETLQFFHQSCFEAEWQCVMSVLSLHIRNVMCFSHFHLLPWQYHECPNWPSWVWETWNKAKSLQSSQPALKNCEWTFEIWGLFVTQRYHSNI